MRLLRLSPLLCAILCVVLCVVLCAWPSLAATPYLVEDIDTSPRPAGSSPGPFVTVGRVDVFVADDRRTGRELWRSDGTPEGTYLLEDICPGSCASGPQPLLATGQLYFFTAYRRDPGLPPTAHPEIWVTGGDITNTIRLATDVTGGWNGGVWLPGKKVALFYGSDPEHGAELWRSDGTPAGTYRLAERPGQAGLAPFPFQVIDDRAFFVGYGPGLESALWTSDGTAAGTRKVRSFTSYTQGVPAIRHLTLAGRRLFFTAHEAASGVELWTSDGTPEGTRRVADLARGTASPAFWSLSALGDRVVFMAAVGTKGQELWASDGTARGTRALTDFAGATPFTIPQTGTDPYEFPRVRFGNRLLFVADDGTHGLEPWVTDGTRAGTFLLADICPGSCAGWRTVTETLVHGSRIFFTPWNTTLGQEVWVSDGTPAGTRIVRNICRGACNASPWLWRPRGDRVLFMAASEQSRLDLWSTDGTSQGTVRISNFTPDSVRIEPFYGNNLRESGPLLFPASEPLHGRELWRTDGTRAGTSLVSDINDYDFGGSFPVGFQAFGNRVLFFAYDDVHGYELWESDGTAPGTSLLNEFVPGDGPPPSSFSGLKLDRAVQAGGLLFFTGYRLSGVNHGLWRTDGTAAGTLQLTPEEVEIGFASLAVLNGAAYFGADDGVHGAGLWKSDGTIQGTVRVKDLGAPVREMVSFQGKLVFAAGSETTGYTLWSSNGTAAGTLQIGSFTRRIQPGHFTERAGQLYFFAADEESGVELWRTNGTAAGTARVTDLGPGANSFEPDTLVALPSGLLLSGRADGTILSGLWHSNGTAAGTRRIGPQRITWPFLGDTLDAGTVPVINGRAFFRGPVTVDGASQDGLWMTDGTEEGTRAVRDRNGHFLLQPRYPVVAGGRMFLAADQGSGTWAYWQTDGTEASFSPLADFSELIPSGPPAVVGSRLFFQCLDWRRGSELCAVPIQ